MARVALGTGAGPGRSLVALLAVLVLGGGCSTPQPAAAPSGQEHATAPLPASDVVTADTRRVAEASIEGVSAPIPDSTPGSNDTTGHRPDFSGTWTLNPQRSDDAKDLIASTQSPRAASMTRPGGAPPRPRGGTRRGPGSGDANLGILLADVLTIVQQGDLLRIEFTEGQSRTIYTDGRGTSVSAIADSSHVLTIASWEDAALVVETNSSEGPRLVRRYRLATGGQQLEISTRFGWKSGAELSVINQVYDATAD